MFLPSSSGPPLKAGLIRSSSIGDVVLATACLHLLSKLNMPVEVTWIGKNPALELLRSSFPAMRILSVADGFKMQELTENLRDLHFLVDLQANLRSRLIGRAFKKAWKRPVWTAHKNGLQRRSLVLESRVRGRSRTLAPAAMNPGTLQYRMMTDTLLKALEEHLSPEFLNDIRGFDPFPRLEVAHALTQRSWQKELNFGTWLPVAAGASYETKRAPVGLLADIISRVRDKYYQRKGAGARPLGLLFLGDQKDRQISLQLLDRLGWNDPVLNLAGSLSLWESALALNGRACLLSSDSSLSHIAEAVNTPVAVLFGPTIERFGFAPRMSSSRSFSANLGCRPCSLHGQTPCRYADQLCFTALSPEDIAGYCVAKLVKGSTASKGESGDEC